MGTARLYRDSKPSKSHRIAQPTVPLGPMRFSFETELVQYCASLAAGCRCGSRNGVAMNFSRAGPWGLSRG